MVALLGALTTTACGQNPEQRQAAADARAASFTPPSVTSRIDFGTMMDRRFRTLDRDGNDIISSDEMPRQNSRLRELDRNGDGQVTASEFSEGMLGFFDRMDLNRDGTVTSEERETYRSRPVSTPTPVNSAPRLP
ncbi:EF-hand domain-containing protein [Sphingomonas rubra]|uniref:EF hand n=1 Tax=Sphingomonas rubra TaxID=634430 RepID=A0A1I5UL66_9SPHN|nr:hypothetical protein [Sphingomonas rubra]SFP96051.1 EF hand [Sphingomonas rubra]